MRVPKLILFTFFLLAGGFSIAQDEDSVQLHQTLREFYTNSDFITKYNRELRRVRKVWPMALEAKRILREHEEEVENMNRKGKIRRHSRRTHRQLKDDFTYSIRDLYVSEGKLLMQLVHRETGETVNDIIKDYRGDLQAAFYNGVGSLFDQSLDVEYEKNGENWITEIVIEDILNGQVEFENDLDLLTKKEFKKSQKEYRKKKRESHRKMRELKRKNRKEKRAKRREKRRKR